jgi:hypothetical protein
MVATFDPDTAIGLSEQNAIAYSPSGMKTAKRGVSLALLPADRQTQRWWLQ